MKGSEKGSTLKGKNLLLKGGEQFFPFSVDLFSENSSTKL